MKIVIGSDHAGFHLKTELAAFLEGSGHQVEDIGSFTPEAVDFPDIARDLCAAVKSGVNERGILVCGTGVGASIAANKVRGIRAAVGHDIHSAHQAVEHDDVNVLKRWLCNRIVATKLKPASAFLSFLGRPWTFVRFGMVAVYVL